MSVNRRTFLGSVLGTFFVSQEPYIARIAIPAPVAVRAALVLPNGLVIDGPPIYHVRSFRKYNTVFLNIVRVKPEYSLLFESRVEFIGADARTVLDPKVSGFGSSRDRTLGISVNVPKDHRINELLHELPGVQWSRHLTVAYRTGPGSSFGIGDGKPPTYEDKA